MSTALLLVVVAALSLPEAPAQAVAARAAEGAAVYRALCSDCHGYQANGCGTAAARFDPGPTNLTRSAIGAGATARIIRRGGDAVGRSPWMPAYESRLGEQDIRDVTAYLGTLEPREGC